MDIKDVNSIIAEISDLKNRGVVLSEDLDCDRISSEYEDIEYQFSKGRYVLPKMYRLVKGIQKSINACLYGNDIDVFVTLFSTVEAIRQKLGQEYQKRTKISSQVRDLRKILNEEKPVS